MSYNPTQDHAAFATAVVEAINEENIYLLEKLAKIAKDQGFDEDAEDIQKEIDYLNLPVDEDRIPRLTASDVL
jgi:uncharacterized protein YihD (DUF1040 family)